MTLHSEWDLIIFNRFIFSTTYAKNVYLQNMHSKHRWSYKWCAAQPKLLVNRERQRAGLTNLAYLEVNNLLSRWAFFARVSPLGFRGHEISFYLTSDRHTSFFPELSFSLLSSRLRKPRAWPKSEQCQIQCTQRCSPPWAIMYISTSP